MIKRDFLLGELLIAAMVVMALPFLGGGSHAGDGYPQNGAYEIGDREIELVDGRYSDIDGRVSVADVSRGDVDGDGDEDLMVVLVQNSRGSGVFYFLNLLLGDGSGGHALAGGAFLGDRIRVDALSIDSEQSVASVALRTHGNDQPLAAAPERAVTRSFRVVDGALDEFDPRAERAARLLAPFKQRLKAALVDGLAAGPEAAIDACKVKAPEIAAGLSTDGVVVGRSSHRLRNPANAPPGWVAPVIDAYVDDPASRQPRVVELDAERIGYVEPIALQPMCTTCHGTAIPADVAGRIAALYPHDEATGFDVGDLRGVFWIETPVH